MASDLSIALQQLHALLLQLEDAERSLSQGPRRIAAAEKILKAGQDEIEKQKLEIKARRKALDEGNLKLKTREAELLKLQGVLNQASSNKEYDIVKGQIAAAVTEKARLEDSALAAMDASEESQKLLKELETVLKTQEEQLKKIRSEVEAAESGLKSEVAALQQKVAEAEKLIPWGDKVTNYGRLRKSHGASAIAPVEDLCCSACSNKLTTQDTVRINTGNLMCCRECGRIVYLIN